MNKEGLNTKYGISLMVMFTLGSSLAIGAASASKQDAWASLLIAVLFAVPLYLIYSRIITNFEGLD